MKVHINNKDHLKEFVRLNEEWISKYFSIEETDKKLAAHPESIIENGGFVFSLCENENVAGVCALFNEGEGVYELARMAVSPKYQGRGFGNMLMNSCLEKTEEIGASRVYLVSNTKLESAIALYKKFGFKAVFEGRHPVYTRANIIMELDK